MDIKFLSFLNSQIITDDYNEKFINYILKLISDYCIADEIILVDLTLKREKDCYSYYQKQYAIKNEDYVVDINYDGLQKLIIRGKKRNFENDIYFNLILSSILQNMFKNKKIIEELKKEKYIDSFLKVYNRRAYDELLLSEKKHYEKIGVLFVDANGLGIINNMYGYEKGDELLMVVSQSLKSNFRMTDIYRIGGDEFVVICSNIDKTQFERKMDLSKQIIESTEFTASFGIVYKNETDDLQSVVEEASYKMKEAKEQFRESHPEIYLDKYKVKQIKL